MKDFSIHTAVDTIRGSPGLFIGLYQHKHPNLDWPDCWVLDKHIVFTKLICSFRFLTSLGGGIKIIGKKEKENGTAGCWIKMVFSSDRRFVTSLGAM